MSLISGTLMCVSSYFWGIYFERDISMVEDIDLSGRQLDRDRLPALHTSLFRDWWSRSDRSLIYCSNIRSYVCHAMHNNQLIIGWNEWLCSLHALWCTVYVWQALRPVSRRSVEVHLFVSLFSVLHDFWIQGILNMCPEVGCIRTRSTEGLIYASLFATLRAYSAASCILSLVQYLFYRPKIADWKNNSWLCVSSTG